MFGLVGVELIGVGQDTVVVHCGHINEWNAQEWGSTA